MSDILATHKRLLAAGLSDEQSKAFLHLVVEAEAGRFDPQAAIDQLRTAQYSAIQATLLLGELLHRLARQKSRAP